MTFYPRRLPLSIALALSPAFAATAAELTPLSVTATRLETAADEVPAAVDVIGRDEIQNARQQIGLDESLARLPGVFMQNRYNFAQDLRLSIRGYGARSAFGIRGIKILVDGIPETLPDGQGNIDSIDIGSIERITVLRGPSSALYGNAAGGALLIESETAPAIPFVALRPAFGSDGFQKHQLKAAGRVDKGDYLLNLSSLDYDGYREHSATRTRNLNSKFNYDLNDRATLTGTLNYTDSPQADDPGGVDYETYINDPQAARDTNVNLQTGESMEQTRLGFVYASDIGRRGELQVRNFYTWKDFDSSLPVADSGIVAYDRFVYGGGVQYTHQGELGGKANRVTIGLDMEAQDDDRTRHANEQGLAGELVLDQNESVFNTGLFISNETTLSDALTLTAGLRYDRIRFEVSDAFTADGDDSGKRTLDHISPSLGLLYAVGPNTRVFASLATGFQTPTTTEFANPDGGGFNPDLDAEVSRSVELGIRGQLGRRSHYEFSVFDISIDDELIPYEADGREYFENAGSSTRRGLELMLSSEPFDGLTTSLAYARNYFEFDRYVSDGTDYSGNTTPGVPRQTLHASLNYSLADKGFAELSWMHAGELYADNANTVKVAGYDVVDLRMGYEWEKENWQLAPFFGINNLTDKHYPGNIRINAFGGRYYEAAPGRTVYGGLALRYNFE
ncbi:TonB-dependent receptor [Granulosicoccaceae sp. 1_MG-2023]|nr:TonB-dependent receptor [Granulosicoccaceae sp. 1_MG-2023]